MVVQTLTYGIRLHPSPAESDLLDRTCTAYLSCCDHVSRVAKSNRTLSQRKLNDLAYRHLRETYHVGSQMAQSAIIRVIGNYRTVKESLGDPWKTKRPLQYTSSGYDLVWNRDYSILSDGRLSVSTLKGRVKLQVDWKGMPEQYRHGRFGTARLLKKRGKWMLLIPSTVELTDPQRPQNVMGVDLGMRFLATSYDSSHKTTFHSGKEVTHKRAHYKALRTGLQKRGTRSARRRLKSIGNRENRWMRDVNHQVSKALVDECEQPTLIVLEDLKGIREATERVGKSRRYVQVSWAFFQLRQMIEYKALKAGHSIMLVDPAYTSQACPRCGLVRKANRKHRAHEYVCAGCGYRSNDDRVAAMNIRRLGYAALVESQTGTS